MIIRSALDTRYLAYPVDYVVGGTIQNPSADPVAFAFMPNPPSASPGVSDWHTGSWITTTSGIYAAQILLGPANGGYVLPVGTYNVWIRITDNPEVPVEQIDLLQIV